jgi:asparagine synthase (glutamine-hydrolysing)
MLSRERLADQGIFDPEAVALILKRLFSRDPGESVAQVWALLVFQHWYDRYRPLHDA